MYAGMKFGGHPIAKRGHQKCFQFLAPAWNSFARAFFQLFYLAEIRDKLFREIRDNLQAMIMLPLALVYFMVH